MDHIPTHAAVHETVEAAKGKLDPARCRFINGVLRNSLRQKDNLNHKLQNTPTHVRFSHPKFLIQSWNKQFGVEATETLCQWNNQRPSNSMRVFPSRGDIATQLLQDLPPHPASPDFFRIIPGGQPIQTISGFKEGAFYVQDPATEIAVQLLDPQPGMKVLDACAAPGGKTFACAERMSDQGQIIALDKHPDRLQQMMQNMERMRFSNIKLQRGDATKSSQLPAGPFDRILLDVPCSNSGVLQRRPDARWRITKARISALQQMQHHLLDANAPLLAPDGALVYSTCSLESAENLACVETWLKENPDYVLRDTASSFPPESGMDGAFAARIERKS
jgi:16S rRNA (cytosine967-C5)-methyltransferase